MKSVIERVLKGASLAAAGLVVAGLVGCGQSGDLHPHHDEDANHSHGQDEDGQAHYGAEDAETDPAVAVDDVAAQKAAYPLEICLVEGAELGSMGEPVEYVHEGRLVMFCCKDCIGDFKADPAKYLVDLDKAATDASRSPAAGEESDQ